MDSQITQQTRENLAQQFRQWAMERNVSLVQTEQMVMAMLSGQYDAQMSRTAQPLGIHQQQQSGFGNAGPAFGFQTPFGTFAMPPMPPVPIPAIPGAYPPPANVVPNMFPTNAMRMSPILPTNQTTKTAFPGGEAVQQSSSHSGQHGNRTFQYNSSSTSMSFSPGAPHLPRPTPLHSIQNIQQPTLPTIASPQAAPVPVTSMSVPPQPQPYMQEPLSNHNIPQPQLQHQPRPPAHSVQAPIAELPPSPEQIFHPITAGQAPQIQRLADLFKRELSEVTYFSDIPGMPDRSVQR